MLSKLFVVAALTMGACYGDAGYGASVTYDGPAQPDLVYAEPGVQVIAGYQEPIFFSDGFYWHNSGGRWYRARDYRHGWEAARAPARISNIQHPERYRNFRGNRARESRR